MTQPEALRLAGELAAEIERTVAVDMLHHNAAAELRRLHQFAEDQIGRATAAEAALQMTKATHALKIAAVEAQRDALLEALKGVLRVADRKTDEFDAARAVIKQVEGEKE